MAIAASSAAFGVANVAKNPSPVFWTTSPPDSAIFCFEHLVVTAEQLLPLVVAERLEKPGRADDVREQERPSRLLTAEELGCPLGIRLRADALEGPVRGFELRGRGVLVALPTEGHSEKEPSLRGLERSPDLAPLVARLTEPADGLVRIALGERDPPGGDVDGGVERGCPAAADLEGVDDLLELRGSGARRLQISRGDGDLHLSRQPPKPGQRFLDLLERARDPRDSRIELPFRETQEGKARLWVVAQLVRARVRLVGGGEVAEAAANLADLVVAQRRDVALEVVQLVTGRRRHLFRGLEITAESHELCAMDTTGAREAGHVQPVAPAVRRLGPLGGPAEVTDVLARADRHAVDERRRVRLELAADCRGRALVEELEPLLDLAALHERAPLGGKREHLRVPVAEAPGELVGVLEVSIAEG